MASPDQSKRKILKAKKTMPASCRKQIELLNKLKNVEALKIATLGNNASSGGQNSNTGVINSICEQSENASMLSTNKNSVFSQNLIKKLETIDIKARLGYTEKQAVCPYRKSSKIADSPCMLIKQKVKDSQSTSKNHFEGHKNVSESSCGHKGAYKIRKPKSPPPIALSGTVKIPKSTVTSNLYGKRNDKIASYLGTKSDSDSLHGKRQNNLSLDSHFVPTEKIRKLANPVIPSNCAADVLQSEESCGNHCSSITSSESVNSTWLSSLGTDSNNSYNQKKRMFSKYKENVKRLKTSEQINKNICVTLEKQTLLEQVRHLIQEEIDNMNCRVFDNKLSELNERLKKTQCNNKLEAVADELFAKIRKLQRRIKTIRNCLEARMLPSEVACKQVPSSESMDLEGRQESVSSRGEKAASEDRLVHPVTSEKVDLPQDPGNVVSESNDDVLLISVEIPNLTSSPTSTTKGSENVASRISNPLPCAETNAMPCLKETPVKENLDFVIDLTEESQSSVADCGKNPAVTKNPELALDLFPKAVSSSKEITNPLLPSTAQVPESFEHLPPLPEPPPPLFELGDKIRDTLPPQKPELKVKRVLRPRGIALTWNITKINPKCAPVESYHLFLCHESPNDKLTWKKVGEIKALPLPMACTLSQFITSRKYYFTVQSKDIFGRYGPFCDIKSIRGFSESLT